MEAEYIKLWNKSFFSLSLLYLVIAVYDFFWVSSIISYCFFLLSVIFFYSLFTDLKFNKLAQVFTYLLLSFIYFFISSHIGFESGIYLYYIPLVLSIPNFLNIKKDTKEILIICFVIVFEFFLDFKISSVIHPQKDAIFLESLLGSLAFIFWIVYFILRKQTVLIKYYKKKTGIRSAEVDIDIDKLNEVVDLARKADCIFFIKFKDLYPYFCERLIEIQPSIVTTELEFCAYIKLGFSTKEIARYTSSSVRSIEGKKYRIRKKYSIPEKVDIYVWIANL
ncbi:DNA-binding CsgD family transcriptional regulator [Flavobacterium arsenatis]|uniref:DNA-binding CsgD family transcriptional regulator n=2 Tax=Flavobacterium arsenatis TaxID=1484332 RepID=A0ABU1TMW6_9FLAO|nr:DNA-binding CsgD family transcriptional regulator [Flavobacterium arsenatis]